MPTARSTSLQLLTAKERYLSWFNGQLLGIGKTPVEDISESLASGVLIILAVAVSFQFKKISPQPASLCKIVQ